SLTHQATHYLSQVIRNMVSGCGDGGKTMSYSCFCVSSSAKFESIINRDVASKCMPNVPAATSDALEVFESYCNFLPLPAGISQSLNHDREKDGF
ncbi:hypothetical protein C8A00DRAFT_19509, partial [Chaetomidium leptoderma]